MGWLNLGNPQKVDLTLRVLNMTNNIDFGLQLDSAEALDDIDFRDNFSGISANSSTTYNIMSVMNTYSVKTGDEISLQ